jgi:hypothetical protein
MGNLVDAKDKDRVKEAWEIAREKGGPTVKEPNRPYCKPDQSCCDFCCGN